MSNLTANDLTTKGVAGCARQAREEIRCMSFQLIFTAQYEKRVARFLNRHHDLEKQYLKTLQLLEMNPNHPSLRLHALSGRL